MTNAVAIAQQGSNNTTFRNRIINGAMMIDQRNAGGAVTANNSYPVDRFQYQFSGSFTLTLQQSSTAPTGFTNSLSATVTSSAAVGSGDYAIITQRVEGYNIADLAFGTANAKTITLSFWVQSSVTGTFSGVLNNNGSSRSYPFTYTINNANTFEYKTITIAGDTTGTWNTTNSSGFQVRWALAVGSTLAGTAGSWSGSTYFGATGGTNLVTTGSATWYVTGFQIEAGSTASPFEYRSYGTEFDLCRRYYEQLNFSSASSATVNEYIGIGMGWSTTDGRIVLSYYPKRSSTTCALNGGTIRFAYSGGGATTGSGFTFDNAGPNSVLMYNTGLSGFSAGMALQVFGQSAGNISFSAEL